MKATNIDINGKTRKLKNLVQGNCKFPFKYRRKDIFECPTRKDGKWCATSIDVNKKMKTWGYCTGNSCPPGKIVNPKTGRCVKKTLKKPKKTKEPKKKMIIDRNNVLNDILKLGKGTDCSLFFKPESDIVFLGEGVANKVYLSCLNNDCQRKVAVRIMSIDNTIPYDSTHANKIELKVYNIFNNLLKKNITQHIPYKIKNFKCSISKLKTSLISNVISSYSHLYSYGEIKKDLDILITEYCKYGTAHKFLERNMKNLSDLDLKILIFQFMSGLVTIQYHIPHFKHNDIHANNILVGTYNLKNQDRVSNKYIKYILFGKEFYIPYREFCVKIYDFDTISSSQFENKKLEDDIYTEIGIQKEDNPVFDYHLGMNTMFDIKDFKKNHIQSKEFFNKQIPDRFRGSENSYVYYSRLTNFFQTFDLTDTNLMPTDIQTPADVIINDNFFDEFRIKPTDCEIVDTIDSKIPKYDKIKDLKYMFK